jgi:hypothetical protein
LAEPESTITGKKPPKKAAPKKPSLTKQESSVFNDMSNTIKAEGKANPKQLKADVARVAEDQAKEDNLTGMAHPDAKALVAAGVPEDRVKALTTANNVAHPANTGFTVDPSNPKQYSADVLSLAGLPVNADNEGLLEQQITEEGMPGGENNPLATSLKESGSKSVNSDGVQEYPSLLEGAEAEASTLKQKNMSSIYDALLSGNETPAEYAAGLANSDYEGLGGSSNPANVAYANAYLGDPAATSFASGGASSGVAGGTDLGTDALSQASSSNLFSGLNSTIPQLGTEGATSSLQSALAGLGSTASQQTLAANTSDAPGSPDQTNSQTQQTNVNPAATYQAQLTALLGKNVQAGTAGKGAVNG